MTITTTCTRKAITRTAAVAAASGFAAFSLAGPALADRTEDILTGGRFCSTTAPFTCDPTHLNLTVPADANAVQLSFTPNPNPCPDLTVNIFEGGKAYPLNQNVATTPGVHNVMVIPTCSQQLESWGGSVHVTYITSASGTPGATHTVLSDVRLFDKPNGNDLGVDLKTGDSVTLNGPCPINNANNQDGANGWCVVTDTTINRSGAVWGDAISK
jgi:hypothetical protein